MLCDIDVVEVRFTTIDAKGHHGPALRCKDRETREVSKNHRPPACRVENRVFSGLTAYIPPDIRSPLDRVASPTVCPPNLRHAECFSFKSQLRWLCGKSLCEVCCS